LFIIAMIALSAILAGYESIVRLINPQALTNLVWVLAAGIIGFAGSELVAIYSIRVGRRIRSAALVAMLLWGTARDIGRRLLAESTQTRRPRRNNPSGRAGRSGRRGASIALERQPPPSGRQHLHR
jgi:hypothetical protein